MKVFITGGSTGIGYQLAKTYADEGYLVGVCGRDESKFVPYDNVHFYRADVSHKSEIQTVINEFSQGELDLLIANAGISMGNKTVIPDFDAYENVLNINIKGVLYSFEAALKMMLPKSKGHLVAISSVAGLVGLPGAGAYSASKSAVIKMCESWNIDLGPKGIDVSCICPGFIDTPLTKKNNHPMPFLMSVEEGGKLIKKAIDGKVQFYAFPLPMAFVTWFLKVIPRFLYKKLMTIKLFNYSRS